MTKELNEKSRGRRDLEFERTLSIPSVLNTSINFSTYLAHLLIVRFSVSRLRSTALASKMERCISAGDNSSENPLVEPEC